MRKIIVKVKARVTIPDTSPCNGQRKILDRKIEDLAQLFQLCNKYCAVKETASELEIAMPELLKYDPIATREEIDEALKEQRSRSNLRKMINQYGIPKTVLDEQDRYRDVIEGRRKPETGLEKMISRTKDDPAKVLVWIGLDSPAAAIVFGYLRAYYSPNQCPLWPPTRKGNFWSIFP